MPVEEALPEQCFLSPYTPSKTKGAHTYVCDCYVETTTTPPSAITTTTTATAAATAAAHNKGGEGGGRGRATAADSPAGPTTAREAVDKFTIQSNNAPTNAPAVALAGNIQQQGGFYASSTAATSTASSTLSTAATAATAAAATSATTARRSIAVALVDLSCAPAALCLDFVALALSARWVSLELVYRDIPGGAGGGGGGERGGGRGGGWGAFVCRHPTGPSRPAQRGGGGGKKGRGGGQGAPPLVIAGAALCFGNDVAYYLPLPCPLPICPQPCKPTPSSTSTSTSTTINANTNTNANANANAIVQFSDLPLGALVLVARLVGVDRNLRVSEVLSEAYTEATQAFSLRRKRSFRPHAASKLPSGSVPTTSTTSTTTTTTTTTTGLNPLFLVSRACNGACRRAVTEEWRRGRGSEWRILNALLSSPGTTIAGTDIKVRYAL
jgi:hypothetical protein